MLIQVVFGNSTTRYTYHCPDGTDIRSGDAVIVPGRFGGTTQAKVVGLGSDYVKDIVSVEPRPRFHVRIVSSLTGESIMHDWDTLEQAETYLRQWLRQGNYSEASITCGP